MSTVYVINKGVNKSIEFKGLRAQYIAYLAVGLVFLLLTFVILYLSKVPLVILVPIVTASGSGLFFSVYRLSSRFGQHGLLKYLSKRRLPDLIKFRSIKIFFQLQNP